METKKNPKADVRRNSSIYFAVGLALMLLVANYSINYKTYNKGNIDIGQVLIVEPPEEEIPNTKHKEKLPPPPATRALLPDRNTTGST